MDTPELLPNWKDILKLAWVNRVLYLMFAVQIIDIIQNIVKDQPVGVAAVVTAVLAPVGIWVRLLSQVALATSILKFPVSSVMNRPINRPESEGDEP